MTERETYLRETERYLKELLHIHNVNKELFSMDEIEYQEYVDALLDELNAIRKELDDIDNQKYRQ